MQNPTNVLVTGGTGFIGTSLTKALVSRGHEVTVVTRSVQRGSPVQENVHFISGDPASPGDWQARIADHPVIINLAGESIFHRWTAPNKKRITESRIRTTQHIVQALSARKGADTLLLNASAVGYYGFRQDDVIDESGPPGSDFLSLVAQRWEAEARKAEALGVRVVLCRFGIVLGRGGGALRQMLPIFKFGLGSPLGSGRQWFPWIHEEDLLNVILFLGDQGEISGAVNCTAPHPVTNREMTKVLGEVLGRPTFMPAVPGWLLNIGMGELGNVLLQGQRALPNRLLDNGFPFKYPTLKEALLNLLAP